MINSIIEKDMMEIVQGIDLEMCRGKTFLITGATGSIGRYIVFSLLYLNKKYRTECKILALCRSKEKASKVFADSNDVNLVFLFQNVEMPVVYESNVDYIIHTASNSATNLFLTNPVETMQANLLGTNNLLQFAVQKNISGFLFLSSGAVYGNISGIDHNITEEEYYPIPALDLYSAYALGKKTGELLCYSYLKEYGVPSKIVRLSHTYGPGINLLDQHIYSDFVNKILRHEDIIIKGNGMEKRAFCYITDAVRAFLKILFKGQAGQAYNMANNDEFISVAELAYRLTTEVFPERKCNVIVLGKKGVETEEYSMDTTELNNLNWVPQIGVNEGFYRTVRYFEENI